MPRTAGPRRAARRPPGGGGMRRGPAVLGGGCRRGDGPGGGPRGPPRRKSGRPRRGRFPMSALTILLYALVFGLWLVSLRRDGGIGIGFRFLYGLNLALFYLLG